MLIHSSSRTKTMKSKQPGTEMGHKNSDEIEVFMRLTVRLSDSFTQICAQILAVKMMKYLL